MAGDKEAGQVKQLQRGTTIKMNHLAFGPQDFLVYLYYLVVERGA
jgi:hypothetical protein